MYTMQIDCCTVALAEYVDSCLTAWRAMVRVERVAQYINVYSKDKHAVQLVADTARYLRNAQLDQDTQPHLLP